jgi:hypothetical protein
MSSSDFVYRGDLSTTVLPEMLSTVHRYGVPGVMEFSRDDENKRVYFLDGDVIFATSSDRAESLGDFLLRDGKISKAQLRVSADEMDRNPGTRHGAILVQMGFLTAEELGVAVRGQVQTILWSLFNWDRGSVSFRVGRFRDDEAFKIKIPTPRVVLAGCKRIVDPKRVMAALGGRTTVYVQRPRPQHLTSLILDEQEQKILDLVDGRRTLIELCETGPMNAGLNARVLYALHVLGLVEQQNTTATGIKIQVRGS